MNRKTVEAWVAFYFLAIVVACAAPFILATGYPLSTRVAAAGGTLAALGGASILRPVMRAGGPLTYISLRAFSHFPEIVKDDPRWARVNDPDQLSMDHIMQHILGPLLIAAGTLANGFSGFFS
jgi:hypothetical protein